VVFSRFGKDSHGGGEAGRRKPDFSIHALFVRKFGHFARPIFGKEDSPQRHGEASEEKALSSFFFLLCAFVSLLCT
jgi:hypothetical protein